MSRASQEWVIGYLDGSVIITSTMSPGRYLSALPLGGVCLVNGLEASEMWKAYTNVDGSWSFRNSKGHWLSASEGGLAICVENCENSERFFVRRW